MRVAAVGRTRLLYDTIRSLAVAGHEIALIATCRAAPEYDIREDDFRALAAELGAQFALTQDLNSKDSLALLKRACADIAVSVNWINVMRKDAIETFAHGVLNAHAGELPRYRGNAPVAWAILQGEARVGLTIHLMVPEEIDAGPIVMTDHFALTETTYIGDVFRFLERRVPEMFVAAVTGLAEGTITLCPQSTDSSLALRCYPRQPEDGLIDWSLPAIAIGRLVRASAEPFPGAFTYLRGECLTVWRARSEAWPCPSLAVAGQVVRRDQISGEVRVATGDGMLVLEEIQSARSGRCRPALVITSLRDRLGRRPDAGAGESAEIRRRLP